MLARARQLGCEAETLALGALGRRRALRGETDEAKRLLAEAVRRVETIDARLGIAVNLDLLADVASSEGNDRLAVRLGAAAADLLDELGAPFPARRRLPGSELRAAGHRRARAAARAAARQGPDQGDDGGRHPRDGRRRRPGRRRGAERITIAQLASAEGARVPHGHSLVRRSFCFAGRCVTVEVDFGSPSPRTGDVARADRVLGSLAVAKDAG